MKNKLMSIHISLVISTGLIMLIFKSDLLTNIFDTMCSISTIVIMIFAAKKISRIKKEVKLITIGFIVWLISDVTVLLQYSNKGSVLLNKIPPYLYQLSALFFTISCLWYFYKNIKEWHKFQLLIDSLYIVTSIILVFYHFFANQYPLITDSLDENILNFMFVMSKILMLIIIYILISSKRKGKVNLLLKSYIIAFLFFVMVELINATYYITGTNIMASWLSYMYIIFQGAIVLSTLMFKEEKRHKKIIENKSMNFENIGKSKIAYIIILSALVMLYFQVISIKLMVVIVIVTFLYIVFASYLKNLLRTEELLSKEQLLTTNLEEVIKERTKMLRNANKKLLEQSERDVLTGLYNRYFFFKTLNQFIEDENSFSLLYLDLNRFKSINDLYGHSIGDLVIQEISRRFANNICPDCLMARIGGDEFGVLIKTVDLKSIETYSNTIQKLVEKEMLIQAYRFSLSISIGAARYPTDARTSKELVEHADIAMYHAKKNRNNQEIFIYNDDLVNRIERRNRIEWHLKTINYDDEFEVFYQPQIRIDKEELIGMEALIRWHSPELGRISPFEFIPIAEETNCILDITNWVMKKAFKQIQKWNTAYHEDLMMGINISPMCFDAVDFIPNLKLAIKKYKIKPSWLDFEITEHSAITAVDNMIPIFEDLAILGIKISIDDFGTGYSSLSYLKRFNIDRIKIAKELIDNIVEDHKEQVIVKAIIMIAKELDLLVIAEGVETKEQLDVLSEIGCQEIQGYYFGKPTSAKEFERVFL